MQRTFRERLERDRGCNSSGLKSPSPAGRQSGLTVVGAMTREAAQEFAVSKGLIGRKVGMTTVFGTDGSAQAVTVVEVQPNVVFGHRTTERDGYTALQLAHEELSEKQQRNARKPELVALKKRDLKAHRRIREFP